MADLLTAVLGNPLTLLLLIVVAGLALGRLEVGGLSLGTSGVLFAALAAGHLRTRHPELIQPLPALVGTFGVVLFVYAVGLQAGPRFFKTFRAQGRRMVLIAFAAPLTGALAAVGCALAFDLTPAIATGVFAGSLTTTPGLAAALDVLHDPAVSVGYGVAYPVGVVAVVLFVQLVPRMLGVDLDEETAAAEREVRGPQIKAVWFPVNNANCAGRTLAELNLAGLTSAVFSRLQRGDQFMPLLDDTRLELGDRVKAAGTPDDRRLLATLLGPELPDSTVDETKGDLIAREVFITSEERSGRSLAELRIKESYGLVVTRIWRQDLEFLPRAGQLLEFGDLVRVVGPRPSVERFIADFGLNERRLEETNFLPLILGMLVGILAGLVPVRLFGLEFKLGMAGGPLFVALLLAHLGRLGPFTMRVPNAARHFTRELGLMLFLASAGMSAGEGLAGLLASHGVVLLVCPLLVKLPALGVALLLARAARIRTISSLGLVCGAVTSTPALGVLTARVRSEVPALAYATVYPAALVGVTIVAQGLAVLVVRILGAG